MLIGKCAAVVIALALSVPLVGSFKVAPDKENVVSSRLAGKWVPDQELTTRLGKKLKPEAFIEFRLDPSIAEKIPDKYSEGLKDKQLYAGGMMTWDGKDYAFVLTEMRGNPHLVMFRERDGDPMGDAESCNVMLAPAKDSKNDVLLVGADFNNEPFKAYQRAERVEAK